MRDQIEVVNSVERALSIIEALSRSGEMGITDLSRELDLGKPTVYRLISTLRVLGYVVQTTSDKYRLTLKVFEISSKVVNRLGVRNLAYPYMEQLAVLTNETINLAMLDGGEVVFLERIDSREPLSKGLEVGTRFPAYCSALGLALLAHSDPPKVDKLLEQMEREGRIIKYTDNTLIDLDLLRKELQKVKAQGYAFDDERYLPGIRGIAAPILNNVGKILAAISIAGPKGRLTGEVVAGFVPIVIRTAKAISSRLGYSR